MEKKLQEGKGELKIAKVDGDVKSEPTSKKKEFANLVEAYKVQNPEKYKLKKEALEKQLKNL